jgi:uncharacterized protein YneF (UPF0154 family)
MTAPDAAVMPPVAKPAALWEDFIDIFHAPSEVFARRRDANPWPMILIVTVLVVLLSVLTFNSLVGVMEPMMRRGMEKAMASNPRFTQDMMESQLRTGLKIAPWFPVLAPIFMLIGALVVWLVGKLFGSKASYTQSLLIVAYACITFVVGYLITGAQALLLDTTTLTNPVQLSTGPARFVDTATASPWMLGLMLSLDVISLWRLALIAIGVYVIGKTSRNAAWMFAITVFVLMYLMNVRNAMSMVG